MHTHTHTQTAIFTVLLLKLYGGAMASFAVLQLRGPGFDPELKLIYVQGFAGSPCVLLFPLIV